MKTHAFLLTAAAVVFAASATWAAPSELQHYAEKAKADAQSLLRATGLDLHGRSVSVRARVDVDGRLEGLQVVRSSGSLTVDRAVEAVLRRVVARDPLTGMNDGAVMMTVAGPALAEAAAQ